MLQTKGRAQNMLLTFMGLCFVIVNYRLKPAVVTVLAS